MIRAQSQGTIVALKQGNHICMRLSNQNIPIEDPEKKRVFLLLTTFENVLYFLFIYKKSKR